MHIKKKKTQDLLTNALPISTGWGFFPPGIKKQKKISTDIIKVVIRVLNYQWAAK